MKKGFTLIELLAVLVVIAIVCAITSIIAINIINKSKESSKRLSASNYINAVNLALSNMKLTKEEHEDGSYIINDSGNIVNYNTNKEYIIKTVGDKPNNGGLIIKNNKVKSSDIIIDGYRITYDGSNYIAQKYNKNSYTGINTVYLENTKPGKITDLKIYGNSTQNVENLYNSNNITDVVISSDGILRKGIIITAYEKKSITIDFENQNTGAAYYRILSNGIYSTTTIVNSSVVNNKLSVSLNEGDKLIFYSNSADYLTGYKNLRIYWSASPSNLIEVVSLGDNGYIDINVNGKNILDLTKYPSDATTTFDLDTIKIKKNANSYSYRRNITLKPNTKYTISCNVLGEFTGRIYAFFGYSLESNEVSNGKWSYTFKTDNNGVFSDKTGISIYQNNSTSDINLNLVSPEIVLSNIQLEENSNVTDYQPFEGKTVHIDLEGHEPLRCVGDVCDYIDYKEGIIKRKIGVVDLKTIDKSKWSFTINNDANYFTTYLSKSVILDPMNSDNSQEELLSNFINYKFYAFTYDYKNRTNIGIMGYPDPSSAFMITGETSSFADINAWTSYIINSTKPLYIYYQLKTPVDEKINLPEIIVPSATSHIGVIGASKIEVNN